MCHTTVFSSLISSSDLGFCHTLVLQVINQILKSVKNRLSDCKVQGKKTKRSIQINLLLQENTPTILLNH